MGLRKLMRRSKSHRRALTFGNHAEISPLRFLKCGLLVSSPDRHQNEFHILCHIELSDATAVSIYYLNSRRPVWRQALWMFVL